MLPILLAEDDAAMRGFLARQLRCSGFDVVEARDGVELVGWLSRLGRVRRDGSAGVALVVADVRMPRLSGLDVLAALRSAQWETPVILVTGFGSDELHAEAQSLGACGVLDKPFAFEDLLALIQATITARCDAPAVSGPSEASRPVSGARGVR